MRISIFIEYSSGPSAAPYRPVLILYIFWFLSNRQPFLHQITFLDTCQKTVSTHASQFRSNLYVTPKLTPIMSANVQIDICSPNGRHIKLLFCPPNKGYKYLCIPSVSTFPVAPPCLPSRSRTHRPRRHLRNRSTPLGFEDSSSRIICSNNGDHLQNPRGTFTPSICAFTFHSSSNFLFASLISAFPLKKINLAWSA